ncbi:hypothetical protein J1605_019800 [Eschrichtius robustus]|uniref:Uncharacterized protein n=1 Tax=Eschrichtius robustus TaxID=9764 RepID=A0AB34HID9_ESCRO|nr:hypothetical protein J1605_019800 [Eschrichtius robustus]
MCPNSVIMKPRGRQATALAHKRFPPPLRARGPEGRVRRRRDESRGEDWGRGVASRPGHGHTLPGSSSCVRILLPPSFVVRPIARVTGNPVQGAPPSWTCPRKTLREPQERRRCHRHCRQRVCSFSACPLPAGASADRPRPSPAAPAFLFLVLTPPSLPESCPATSNPPGNPGLPQCPGGRGFLAALSPGRGWGRRRARGAGEGRRRAGRSRAPRRGVGKGVFGLAFPASSAGLGRLAPPAGPVFLPPLSAAADLPRRAASGPEHKRQEPAAPPASWIVSGVLVDVVPGV